MGGDDAWSPPFCSYTAEKPGRSGNMVDIEIRHAAYLRRIPFEKEELPVRPPMSTDRGLSPRALGHDFALGASRNTVSTLRHLEIPIASGKGKTPTVATG